MLSSTARENIFSHTKTLKYCAFNVENISGNGTIHCSFCFPEVMNVLTEKIDVYALAGGPMWIVQRNDWQIIQYVVPPVNISQDEWIEEYEESMKKGKQEVKKGKLEIKIT